jgi:hypothetical protein
MLKVFIHSHFNLTVSYFKVKIFSDHVKMSPGLIQDPYIANFSFVINDIIEFNYANNLLYIYKKIFYPFLEKHASKLDSMSDRMSRFFYIGNLNSTDGSQFGFYDYVGKSFVNLKTSEKMVLPHVPDGPRYDDNINFVSHFRNKYKYGNGDKTIKNLKVDLNYFACYIKSALEA